MTTNVKEPIAGQIFFVHTGEQNGRQAYATGGVIDLAGLGIEPLTDDIKFLCRLNRSTNSFSIGVESTALAGLVDSRDDLAFSTFSQLLRHRIWNTYSDDRYGFFEIAVRKCGIQNNEGKPIYLFCGPLIVANALDVDVMAVYDLENCTSSRISGAIDLKMEATAYRMKTGDAFNGHYANPYFGAAGDRMAVLSTLPLEAQREIHRHAVLFHRLAEPSAPNETSDLADLLKRHGLLSHVRDEEFLQFRKALLEHPKIKPTYEPHTAAELAERDKIAHAILQKVMQSFDGSQEWMR